MSEAIVPHQPSPIQRSNAENNQFLIRRYLDWLRVRNLAESTRRTYGRPLGELAATLGSTSFLELTHADILRFLSTLHGSDLTSSTLFAYCSALRNFGKFLSMLEIPCTDAFRKVRLPKRRTRIGSFHSVKEVEKLLSATRTPRERAVIELLFATGARVGEVEGMRVEQINWNNRSIKVLGKGNRERIVYFGGPAEQALRKHLGGRTDGSLFGLRSRYLERLVATVGSRVGIKSTPHCFRHGFATAMFDAGVGLREVQEILGHQHVTTTARYLHSSVGDLMKTHRQFHPHEDGKAPAQKPRPEPERESPQTEAPHPRLVDVLEYWRDKLGNALDFVAQGNQRANAGKLLEFLKNWDGLPVDFKNDVQAVLRRNGAPIPSREVAFLEFWKQMTPELRAGLSKEGNHGKAR